ncbi:MAG: phosphate/phosphite/phosphonate ABC transporter substrate-binding protein, partial [Chloroflexi bacterium]|nr:phosphate/phosphite/phosphonate ABC transporter substrate-binding protein [Chloroflexota bacterium]
MKKIILLLTTVLLAACSVVPESKVAGKVDLDNLQPLPTPERYDAVPLRVAVAAVISPKGTVES